MASGLKEGENWIWRGGKNQCMEGETEVEDRQDMSQKQQNDPTLKAAWERAKRDKGTTESGARLILREGILYRVGRDFRTKE